MVIHIKETPLGEGGKNFFLKKNHISYKQSRGARDLLTAQRKTCVIPAELVAQLQKKDNRYTYEKQILRI